jgi:hypothetical protein
MPNEQVRLSKEQIVQAIAERKREIRHSLIQAKIEERKKQIAAEIEGKAEPVEKSRSLLELGQEGVRQVGRTGRILATGLASIGDIPNLPALGLHAAGLKETPEFYPSPSRAVQSGIDTLTGDRLKPRNKTEEWIDTIGEGLAPIALAPVTGGASLTSTAAKGLTKAVPKLAQSPIRKVANAKFKPYELTAPKVGANVGASTASKYYSENAEDPGILGTIGAGVLGSVVGGGVGRGATTLPHYVRGHNSTTFNDLKDLGIPMSVSDVTKSKIPTYVDLLLGKDIGGSSVMDKYKHKRNTAFARSLGKTELEPLENHKQISKELAKEGARGYEDLISRTFEKLKEPIVAKEQAALKGHHLVDISELHKELMKEQQPLKSQPAIRKFNKTSAGYFKKEIEEHADSHRPKESDLIAKTTAELKKQNYRDDVIERAIKEAGSHVQNKPTKYDIPYGEFEQLRNEALTRQNRFGNPEDFATYSKFANAREKIMEGLGTPEEVEAYLKANRFYTKFKSKKESNKSIFHLMTEIQGAPDDVVAFKKLTSTNPRYATLVMNGLPKEKQRHLTEAIISDFGKDNGKFNIFKAHAKLSTLDDHVLEANLKGFSPVERRNFTQALKYIGKNKERFGELANTSGTAHTQHVINQSTALGTAGFAAFTGNITPIASAVGGYLLKQGTAKMWTNQTVVKWIDRLITARSHNQKVRALDHLLQNPSVRQVLRENTNEKDKKHP